MRVIDPDHGRRLTLATALLWPFLLTLAGCATPAGTISTPPAYVAPLDGATVTAEAVARAAARLYPAAALDWLDDNYSLVSANWLDSFLTWQWFEAKAAGVAYTAESFDCDDFALGFRFFANRAAGRAGLKSSPLIARVTVAISPTVTHMVVFVATDQGLFVIEPNPAAGAFRTTPAKDFKAPVLKIYL